MHHLAELASRFSLRTQLMAAFGLMMSLLTATTLSVINNELDAHSEFQASSIGQLMSEQTANMVTDMLVTGDRLSLNVFLRQLVDNPYVSTASVYSIDNQRIAFASSDANEVAHSDPKIYSAPINYQDVITGYVRLSLNTEWIEQKPKEAIIVILAVGLLLLLAGLIFIYFYADALGSQLSLIERQLSSITTTIGKPPKNLHSEISRIGTLVERMVIEKRAQEPEAPSPVTTAHTECSMVAAIKVTNFKRMQRLLSIRDLQDILKQLHYIIDCSAQYYGCEVVYTPDGMAYLRFTTQAKSATMDNAVLCTLAIMELTREMNETSVAPVELNIGLSIDNELSEFPENRHPALSESLASEALTLANTPGEHSIIIERSDISWFHHDFPEYERLDDHHLKIVGIKGEFADYVPREIDTLQRALKAR